MVRLSDGRDQSIRSKTIKLDKQKQVLTAWYGVIFWLGKFIVFFSTIFHYLMISTYKSQLFRWITGVIKFISIFVMAYKLQARNYKQENFLNDLILTDWLIKYLINASGALSTYNIKKLNLLVSPNTYKYKFYKNLHKVINLFWNYH